MAKHEDLRILRGIILRQQHQPSNHPDHEEIDEADKHQRKRRSGGTPDSGTAHGPGRRAD